MKPIRIFTHVACEPPGYLKTLLDKLGYENEQVCLLDGKSVPMDLEDIAGLVFMGGPGDVNEPSEWMEQEFELIQKAHARGVPVLGICLGAQLMSKALGGEVFQASGLEVGFHEVRLLQTDNPHPWFDGLPERFTAFQWHAHSVSPPQGVNVLATSECTQCQAYALDNSLALQFHLEMTDGIITSLLDKYAEDLTELSNCVQSAEQIRMNIEQKCQQTFDVADVLLKNWFDHVMLS